METPVARSRRRRRLAWWGLAPLACALAVLALPRPAAPPVLAVNAPAADPAQEPEVPAAASPRSIAEPAAVSTAPARPATPVSTPTAHLELELYAAIDGSPVPDYAVRLQPLDHSAPAPLRARTDARGIARFDDLSPGDYAIEPLAWRGHLPAGTQRVRIELARGPRILGEVVDASGRGVAGAEVIATPNDDSLRDEACVARTDAAGAFAVRLWQPGAYLHARAPGWAPSRMVGRIADVHGATPVRLVLGATPGVVRGVVTAAGQPLAAARIEVSVRADDLPGTPDPTDATYGSATALPCVSTSTDENGAFVAHGIPAGRGSVRVTAAGWAPATAAFALAAGAETTLRIELTPGAVLAGVVRRDGRPLAGVRITVRGAADAAGTAWWRATATDADGAFSLDALPAGRCSATAGLADSRLHREQLMLVAGERAVWDLELDAESARGGIAGTLAHADGTPAANWEVHLMASPQRFRTETDAAGRFEFEDCPLLPYALGALPYEGANIQCVLAEEVRPGDPELQLHLPVPPRGDGWLVLDVAHEDGRAFTGGQVVLVNIGARWLKSMALAPVQPQRIGPLYEGDTEVRVVVPGAPPVRAVVPIRADSEAAHAVRIPEPVTLTIALSGADLRGKVAAAAFDRGRRVGLCRGDAGSTLVFGSGPAMRDPPLGPGRYRVEVAGERVPHLVAQVELGPGAVQHLQLDVPPTRVVRLRAEMGERGATPSAVPLETVDAAGVVLAAWRQSWDSLADGVSLAIRRAAVTLRTGDGSLRGAVPLATDADDYRLVLQHAAH